MADKYPNFAALEKKEQSGKAFRIRVRRAAPAFAIVAPHGGGIEGGTSEIADAIAGETLSFYAFEGLKQSGNRDLHITSTRFDEPLCLTVLARSAIVVTIHGEENDTGGESVFVGGRDASLGHLISVALAEKGFAVRPQPDPNLQGLERENLCNRGTSAAGVQIELSRALRDSLVKMQEAEGRHRPTERFTAFVDTVRALLIPGRT